MLASIPQVAHEAVGVGHEIECQGQRLVTFLPAHGGLERADLGLQTLTAHSTHELVAALDCGRGQGLGHGGHSTHAPHHHDDMLVARHVRVRPYRGPGQQLVAGVQWCKPHQLPVVLQRCSAWPRVR